MVFGSEWTQVGPKLSAVVSTSVFGSQLKRERRKSVPTEEEEAGSLARGAHPHRRGRQATLGGADEGCRQVDATTARQGKDAPWPEAVNQGQIGQVRRSPSLASRSGRRGGHVVLHHAHFSNQILLHK